MRIHARWDSIFAQRVSHAGSVLLCCCCPRARRARVDPPPSTPKLTEDDVREVLRFAAERVDERTITLDQTA